MVRRRLLVVIVILIAALGARSAEAEILIGVAGPMTGKIAWYGEQMQRGAEQAVADINAAGGVVGQQIELIIADDFCEPEQGVAAARKLVSDGVIFVAGHYCSGASIPASEIYQAAGVLMISPTSTNPMLTELGRANVFRVLNRDDANGALIGNYLADHWSDKEIAILHDDTTYRKGAAVEPQQVVLGESESADGRL
jgi:branched-chain amino acid transport system substrate-binding protein